MRDTVASILHSFYAEYGAFLYLSKEYLDHLDERLVAMVLDHVSLAVDRHHLTLVPQAGHLLSVIRRDQPSLGRITECRALRRHAIDVTGRSATLAASSRIHGQERPPLSALNVPACKHDHLGEASFCAGGSIVAPIV